MGTSISLHTLLNKEMVKDDLDLNLTLPLGRVVSGY